MLLLRVFILSVLFLNFMYFDFFARRNEVIFSLGETRLFYGSFIMNRDGFLLVLFFLFKIIFLVFVVHEAGWLSGFMEASSMCEDLLP